MRTAFRALQGYYRSHFAKPAESGAFIHASIKWLGRVFPSVSTTRDTARSARPQQIFSELNSLKYSASSPAKSEDVHSEFIPAPLPLSSRSRYSHYYNSVQETYSTYLRAKLFSTWRQFSHAISSFREQRANRFILRAFRAWGRYSARRRLMATIKSS